MLNLTEINSRIPKFQCQIQLRSYKLLTCLLWTRQLCYFTCTA